MPTGLAVSLSAGLAQNVQKLAQVIPPGPGAGPAARQGAQPQPGIRPSIEPWNALQPGIRPSIEPWNAPPPGIRPGLEPRNAPQPGIRPSIEPWNAEPKPQPGAPVRVSSRGTPNLSPNRVRVQVRTCGDRRTRTPQKLRPTRPAGCRCGSKGSVGTVSDAPPPPPFPPSGLFGLLPPTFGLVGLGALGLSLALSLPLADQASRCGPANYSRNADCGHRRDNRR